MVDLDLLVVLVEEVSRTVQGCTQIDLSMSRLRPRFYFSVFFLPIDLRRIDFFPLFVDPRFSHSPSSLDYRELKTFRFVTRSLDLSRYSFFSQPLHFTFVLYGKMWVFSPTAFMLLTVVYPHNYISLTLRVRDEHPHILLNS